MKIKIVLNNGNYQVCTSPASDHNTRSEGLVVGCVVLKEASTYCEIRKSSK